MLLVARFDNKQAFRKAYFRAPLEVLEYELVRADSPNVE
jgi:hypothetical protein